MSVTKAIQFQHLISQLTHQERIGFLSKLLDSHTDIILASLFQHLVKPNQINEANAFNQELSSIIQSRKEKEKAEKAEKPKLEQLPRAIIGYVASFLDQSEYPQFNRSNRFIYLGCNTPNTLQELDLTALKDFSFINLSSFTSIKTLRIDPSKTIKSQHMYNQVTTLTLNANSKRGWVESFLNQNIVNCDNVTTLVCNEFGTINVPKIQKNNFLSLLAMFRNITHFRMWDVQVTGDITEQDITDLCLKIVGLGLYDGAGQNKFLNIFGSQLKYLSLTQYSEYSFDCRNITFDKLEELRMVFPDDQLLGTILKSASKLKKIFIRYFDFGDCKDTIKHDVPNLITKCASLNYMAFSIASHSFCSLLEGIEHGLFKTKTQHRTQLKIRIDVPNDDFQPKDFTFNVARIINALEACNINDFMFIWKLPRLTDDESTALHKDLRNISMHSQAFQSQCERNSTFIITNPNCTIN
eukprot:595405_1